MNGCTAVGQSTAVVAKGEVDVTEELAPTPGSDDEDLLARGIIDNGWVLALSIGHVTKLGVGVAADNERDTLSLFGKLLVNIVSEMAEDNNASDICLVADLVNVLLDLGNGLDKPSLVSDVGNAGGVLGSGTNDGDLVLLEDDVRLNGLIQRFVVTLNILFRTY